MLEDLNFNVQKKARVQMNMKTCLSLGWIVACLTLFSGCGRSACPVEPAHARPYAVRVQESPATWERTAAAELSDYLGRISESGKITVDGSDAVVFHVGDTDFAKSKGLGSSVFKDEEWCIRSFGRDVVLNGGGTRGCLYAVYHFLEDFCGVCWWNDTDEDVPAAKPLAFPALDRRGRPFFSYRDIYRDDKSSPKFAARCRVNGNGVSWIPPELGGGFVYGPPYHTHTWDRYFPFEKYGKEHPEWYAYRKKEGKRCGGQQTAQMCLSCPGLTDRFAAAVEESIAKGEAEARAKGLPPPRVYDLTMNDNKGYCECDRCQSDTEKYGHSGVQLRFVNAIAKKLGARHPDLFFSTAAYHYSEPTPKGGVRAADNVIVKLCNTRQNMGAGITHPDNKVMHDLVREWNRFTKRLYVWEYAITFAKPTTGFPFPSEYHIADKYRYYADNGVSGFLIEHERNDCADMLELKFYLERKVLEDPYQDPEKLLDGFYARYFGAAAPRVREARDYLRKIFDARKVNLGWFQSAGGFNWIRRDDVEHAQKLFDAAAAAVRGDAKLVARVKRARLSLDRVAEFRNKGFKLSPPEKGVADRAFIDFPIDEHLWKLWRDYPKVVKDPTARNGKAVRLAADSDRGFKFPIPFGLAQPQAKKSVKSLQIKEPAGAGWQWYELKGVQFPEDDVYAYFTWLIQVHYTTPEIVGKTFDIKVHVRFEPDAAYVDRFVFVQAD